MRRRVGSFVCLCILTLLGSAVDSRAANKPNIILITFDSVRADRMGFLGAHGDPTPTLDRIAKDSLVFSQAYAQAPLTVASHATILTGTYPQVHRAGQFAVPLSSQLPYLPELLHSAGYHTAAFVGSMELDPRNGPFQGYDRGFDVFDASFHQPRAGESRYQSVQRRAVDVVANAKKWAASSKQRPFFLWINLSDADDTSGAAYDRAIGTVDAAVGKLTQSLQAQSVYDGSVILLASPHGESLGVHGEDSHGMFLYDETIHVPLVIRLPKGLIGAKAVKNRVGLVDMAPTVLEAAGLSVPSQMQGRSLIRVAQSSSAADQPSYARSDLPAQAFHCSTIESWRAGKYLYIRAPQPELYDLSADPRATHNLAQTSKATLDTMASQLQAFDNRLAGDAGKGNEGTLSSSEMQKLASLGYVGLQKSGAGVRAGVTGVDPKDAIGAANKTLAAWGDIDSGRSENATVVLKGLAISQPESYLAQYGLGMSLFQQQKCAGAIPYLHKAIELQPESPWAHYTMGACLMKTGDFKTAAVHLEIASSRLPNFSAVHSVLADAYDRLGRGDDAKRQRAAISTGERKKND